MLTFNAHGLLPAIPSIFIISVRVPANEAGPEERRGRGLESGNSGGSMKKAGWLICLLWSVLFVGSGYGHDVPGPGIEEKTGRFLPPDLAFYDEKGELVRLNSLLGRPVILTRVYYSCERICPQVLGGLSQALPRLAFEPGKDYRVVTVSFDASDTPQIARAAKQNYLKAIGRPFPEEAWKFLTGPERSIHDLTEAVGFSFRKEIHGFSHPVVLIFLTPDGRISRYYQVTNFAYGASYPVSFSSFDLNMALTEAAQGKSVTGLKKALLYCFSHEPPGQSRFFNFIGVVGLITLAAMAAFFVYLQVTARRIREGRDHDAQQ
jgi:protein SCO1/2